MSKASAEQALEIYHIIRQEVDGKWTKTSIDTTVGMAVTTLAHDGLVDIVLDTKAETVHEKGYS